ncbi:CaiB/BaiF CoA transferase family protein [Actinospica robiniae]|uniref:CaiB/BaiF CoA transferase family protein n=1 Tax=Actinospica robiniae TaxID=304901 RepID=UPI000685E282|nr:CoA transferase [Actinospica robiniae]
MKPLDGVLIADFSRVLAGPYATMLLADLGAQVVKVERPGIGDDTRAWGPPFADSTATYFLGVNRNKQSVALDFTTAEDAALARELVRRADVVVENFLPGTMDRHGLGYEQVRELNPGVVYCSITGFGADEGAGLPGYDLIVQAVGGLMSVTGETGGSGTKVGVALVDVVTGLHAAFGIMAALRHREQGGPGQRVEVSLLTSLLSGLSNHSSGYLAAGVVPRALGNAHPSIAPYEVYQAADRPIVIAAGNDRQFERLCAALGAAELAADPRFGGNRERVAHRDELAAELNRLLSARDADAWFTALSAAAVPCGPINDLAEAFALAERLGLGAVAEVEDPRRDGPLRQVAHPIAFSETPATYRSAPPRLDEDGAEIRRLLAHYARTAQSHGTE